MKNLILRCGRFFINAGMFFQLLVITALAWIGGVSTALASEDDGAGYFVGILIFLILFIVFVLSNYLLCLLIGIHDSQATIAKSLDLIAKKYINTDDCIPNNLEPNKCPNCGTVYKDNDKFCEKCGTKLIEE